MNFYFFIPVFVDSKISTSKRGEYKGRWRESSARLMCTKNEQGWTNPHWLMVPFLSAKGMDRSRVHYKNNV